MLKAFMASALILASTLTMSAPVTAQTQEPVQGKSYQVAQTRSSRAYVLSATRPITGIVRKLLKEGMFPSRIRPTGYKVTVRNRVATIDFRIGPNSRSIASSTGSELSRLDSFEKTLTENSQLNIDKVVIFENGRLFWDK